MLPRRGIGFRMDAKLSGFEANHKLGPDLWYISHLKLVVSWANIPQRESGHRSVEETFRDRPEDQFLERRYVV